MDRAFLTYYEAELTHIRELSQEFAAQHPNVARNLSLDSMPCPDPYVERLLEGVAYLAARTRLKLDVEGQRLVRGILDALYPDLAGPAPAMTLAELVPGPQVLTMTAGHQVPRGTRLIAALRDGVTTRATYTTVQAVTLWPLELAVAEHLPDRGALAAAGLTGAVQRAAESGLRLTLRATGPVALGDLALDRLDLCFAGARGAALFDGIHGAPLPVQARAGKVGPFHTAAPPGLVGIGEDEALLPRLRSAFEGYRLLREYFLMPDRFHACRLTGLAPAVRMAGHGTLDLILPFARSSPALAGVGARDFRLFVTPVINLFERECNTIELDPRTTAHVVHADRSRPLDFEIHRLTAVSDADSDDAGSALSPVYAPGARGGGGLVYATDRRPRRLSVDEARRGQPRTSYTGDDLFVSVARPDHVTQTRPLMRLDLRALVSNRDLPILDDTPRLMPESGDPVARVDLLSPMRRPRAALVAQLPQAGRNGEIAQDDLTWRLIGQFALNHLSLAEAGRDAAPLRAMLDLYADRGDPALARHVRALAAVRSRDVIDRLDLPGPLCLGQGVEITLDVDEAPLSGHAVLLLPALLSRLFARSAAINSFVRTRTRTIQAQEEVTWPMTRGNRAPI